VPLNEGLWLVFQFQIKNKKIVRAKRRNCFALCDKTTLFEK